MLAWTDWAWSPPPLAPPISRAALSKRILRWLSALPAVHGVCLGELGLKVLDGRRELPLHHLATGKFDGLLTSVCPLVVDV